MKVLHVVEAYGGGVLEVVNQLANGFAGRMDVVVAHGRRPETPERPQERLDPRVRVVELALARPIRPLKDAMALARLIALFLRERPDVVHLHSSKAGFLGRIAGALTGCRVLYSPHAFAFLDPNASPVKRRMYWWLEWLAARFGGRIVGCSIDEQRIARQFVREPELVANGVDTAMVDAYRRRESRLPGEPITVATLGRVCEQKRPELFAAVARHVTAQSPVPVRFLWIGGGAPFPASDVEVTGWLPREKALERLGREADIYLQTSSFEGMPLALIEAQILGLPVVATSVSGNESAVAKGITGYLCASKADDLARAVMTLALDSTHRAGMGAAARRNAIEQFGLERMLREYADFYYEP